MQNIKSVDRDYVVVADGEEAGAGATIWWRLHGEADRSKLVMELQSRGIDHMPKVVEPETALRRAVGVLRGKRRLIRPLRRGSWAVVEEELDDLNDKLKHWEGPTISLDKIGRAVLKNSTPEEAQQVREAFDYYLEALETTDISGWLIAQAERLGAIGLREGGGIYYLPPQRMKEWRQLVDALTTVHPKHSIYMVPTVKLTQDGARAILDSLTFEIEAQVATLTSEVVSGDLGVRALDTRADKSKALLTKVTDYEELLGTKLEKLRDQIANLSVDVAAAKLAAEALKDEA
jgi:hypothetical protein